MTAVICSVFHNDLLLQKNSNIQHESITTGTNAYFCSVLVT